MQAKQGRVGDPVAGGSERAEGGRKRAEKPETESTIEGGRNMASTCVQVREDCREKQGEMQQQKRRRKGKRKGRIEAEAEEAAVSRATVERVSEAVQRNAI